MTRSTPPRSRPVRLKDVAAAAKVSISAVSKALSDKSDVSAETRSRVLEASRRMGYRRPGADRRSPSRLVDKRVDYEFGFALVGGHLQDDVFAAALTVMGEYASGHKHRTHFATIPQGLPHEETARRLCDFAAPLNGLVLCGLVELPVLAELHRQNIPCVMLGEYVASPQEQQPEFCHVVTWDHIQIGRFATSSLMNKGMDRVAFVTELAPQGMSHDMTLCGYALAHHDTRRPIDYDLVRIAGQAHTQMEPIAEALLALKRPPQGFVLPDCRIAANFIRAVERKGGKYPREAFIAVVNKGLPSVYGIESYPQIETDGGTITRMCVKHLRRLVENKASYATRIIVPFISRL